MLFRSQVASSQVFASTPGLEVMLAAGSRAVYSYPLLSAAGDPLGVLSFHARRPVARQTQPSAVARSAALALAIVGVDRCEVDGTPRLA